MRGTLVGLVTAALATGVVACGGGEEPTPPPPEVTSATATEEFASDVKIVQRDVALVGGRIVKDQGSRTHNVPELEAKEKQALTLSGQVETQAPHEDAARQPLIDATRDIADAATALLTVANSGENTSAALKRAQDSLDASQRKLDEAAEDLLPRVPPEKRRQVEDLREEPPKLPG